MYIYIYKSNYIKTIIYTAVSYMKYKVSCTFSKLKFFIIVNRNLDFENFCNNCDVVIIQFIVQLAEFENNTLKLLIYAFYVF